MSLVSSSNSWAISSDSTVQTNAFDCSGGNLLVVTISAESIDGVSSVTYNGDSLTQAISTRLAGDSTQVDIYYIVSPDSGSNDLVVTFSGSNTPTTSGSSAIGALSLQGIDILDPLDVTNFETGGTANSTSITTTDVATFVVSGQFTNDEPITGFNQTEFYNYTGGGRSSAAQYGVKDGAGSITFTYTDSSGGSNFKIHSLAAFKLLPDVTVDVDTQNLLFTAEEVTVSGDANVTVTTVNLLETVKDVVVKALENIWSYVSKSANPTWTNQEESTKDDV
jgi:hypothetical protein